MRLGVVVVTHGQLATELVNSAEMIVGDLPHFAAVSIGWHDDVDQAREEIGRAIGRVAASAPGDGERAAVLVLTDMFGGTPANLGVTFVGDGVEVVTRAALAATAVDVLAADAVILGTPANIGYMSGARKRFFDQVYYPCLS